MENKTCYKCNIEKTIDNFQNIMVQKINLIIDVRNVVQLLDSTKIFEIYYYQYNQKNPNPLLSSIPTFILFA